MANSGGRCPALIIRAALFTILFAAGAVSVFGITVTVTGGGSFSIGAADLIGVAGSDLVSDYSSADNAVLVTVADTIGVDDAWQIQVRQEDTLWHGSLSLAVFRTGSGSGTGSVTGGDVLPVDLTAVDQVFFEGAGDVADIPIRVNLSGVSVLIPADSYSATLYFTVVDIP